MKAGAYESKVGSPVRPHCSLCGNHRIVDPDATMVWCRTCDGDALGLSLATRKVI